MRPKSEVDVIADRLFRAIEAGDVDIVSDLYADDVVVWHNFDEATQTKDKSLAVLRWMVKNLAGRRYEVVARYPIEGGFVQQHVLHGTTNSGKPLALPACLVVHVRGGKITRLDEYLDASALSTLFE